MCQCFNTPIQYEHVSEWGLGWPSTTCHHLLGLQVIEGLVEDIVVPLVGDQLMVAVDHGEGVDEGGAKEGVHVFWQVLALVRSVLGPVGEVAHHLLGRCCIGDTRTDLSIH